MKLVLAVAAAAAIAAATPAFAGDDGFSAYGNLGYNAVQFSDGTLSAITGRIGARGKYVGVEGELSGGLGSTTISGVSVNVQDQFAGYIVGFLPLGKGDVFARVGYGEVDLHGSPASALTFTHTETTNLGLGGQWFFDDKNGVRADYTYVKLNDADGHVNTWGLSYVRKF